MARMPDLEAFGKKHGLRVVSIADLIQYRMLTERLVRRVAEHTIRLDQTGTEWTAMVYETSTDQRQFLALTKGDLGGPAPVLTRVHSGSMLADNFASLPNGDGALNLREAVARIEAEGRGVLIRLPPRSTPQAELSTYVAHLNGPPAPEAKEHALREFGLGAQVLVDLGLTKISILTNNPRKIAGLHGFGLEVVDTVPLSKEIDR
jgi:3,4-dihydroxy 2-butanone 4-phosphate synthase/GTP cyclohydrolase II